MSDELERCFRCNKELESTQFKVDINGTLMPEGLPRGGFKDILLCYDCWNGLSDYMWSGGKGFWSRITARFSR